MTISTKTIKLEMKKKTEKSRSVGFMVIRYAITTQRYTIYCIVDYVIRETSMELIRTNI